MKLAINSDAVFALFPRVTGDDNKATAKVVGSDKKAVKLEGIDGARIEFDISGANGVVAVGQVITFTRAGDIEGDVQFVTGGRKEPKAPRTGSTTGSARRPDVQSSRF